MIPAELNAYLAAEIAAFPGKTSLLVADLPTGAVRHAWQPEEPVPSASTIKVPILLAALEEVRRNLGTQFDPQLGLLFIKLVEEGKICPHTGGQEP